MTAPAGFTKESAAGYLAGMLDGDGHIALRRDRHGSPHRYAIIAVTDRELIDACSEACLLLGIEHRTGRIAPRPPGKKIVWTLSIFKISAFEKLAELPIRHAGKRQAVSDALASARPSKKPPRDVLERMYVYEGMSAEAIGKLLGVSTNGVRKWLHRDDIPVRDRSEAAFAGHQTRIALRGTRKTGPRS